LHEKEKRESSKEKNHTSLEDSDYFGDPNKKCLGGEGVGIKKRGERANQIRGEQGDAQSGGEVSAEAWLTRKKKVREERGSRRRRERPIFKNVVCKRGKTTISGVGLEMVVNKAKRRKRRNEGRGRGTKIYKQSAGWGSITTKREKIRLAQCCAEMMLQEGERGNTKKAHGDQKDAWVFEGGERTGVAKAKDREGVGWGGSGWFRAKGAK